MGCTSIRCSTQENYLNDNQKTQNTPQDAQQLPLAGVRVLEFTHAVLGPTCGMILADLGAEVIKVEPAPDGDPTRRLSGFGQGFYPYLNRNRKSIAINVKTEAGISIAHELLATADVLIENFGPGTMDRLGLGYDNLATQYPRLIYCALKGFMPGPYEKRIALDEVVQMMSGLAYMTGPPGTPLRAGASVIDYMTGMYGAIGVLVALRERDETGRGQQVKSALFETAAMVMGQHMAYAAISKQDIPPMPARVSAWGIYHKFETQDDDLVFVGITSDQQWQRFCAEFNQPDLLADERLATNNGRVAEGPWLIPQLQKLFVSMGLAEIVARCEQAHISFSPIARPADLFTDPQLVEGGGLLQTQMPNGETVPLPRLPLQIGEHDLGLRADPPAVGSHTVELLREVGLDDATIEDYKKQGIVAAS